MAITWKSSLRRSHGNRVYNPYKLRTHQRRTTRTLEKNPEKRERERERERERRSRSEWVASDWLQTTVRDPGRPPPCMT